MTFRLETLGTLVLKDGNGTPLAVQRQRLALLTLIAAAGERGLSRDKLVAFLWPESSPENARHSLEQVVFTVRRQLGDSVFLGTDPIRLNRDVITCDLNEFVQALDRGEPQAGLALYQGPFLDGFYLANATEFERWVETERSALQERYLAALESVAQAEAAAGRAADVVALWRRLVKADPLRATGALGLMRALAAAGDHAGALQHARVYEALVRDQLDLPPDPRVAELVAVLRQPEPGAAVREAAPSPPGPPRATDAPAATPIDRASVVPHRVRRAPIRLVTGVLAVGVLVAAAWLWRGAAPRPSGESARSIAVLPFDFIGDPGGDYLADGITEDLIVALSELPSLTVIPRSSAFYYKAKGLDPREVARGLGADYLVTGSARLQGNRLRVTFSLVDVATGRQLRAQSLEREMSEVLGVEQAVANDIASGLGGVVGAAGVLVPPTRDPIAYDLYLRGRHAWNQRTPETLRRAIEYFEQALARDSGFAVGWAGLADAYSLSANFSDVPPAEYLPRAKAAALRAAALDSTRAEVETSLGIVSMFYDGEWAEAERHYRRALALNERYAPAHLFYGWYLVVQGRHDEALREILRARELEPLNLVINVRVGTMYGYIGRAADGMEAFRRALTLEPRSPVARLELRWLHAYLGNIDSALVDLPPLEAHLAGYHAGQLGQLLALAGRRAEALQTLDSLRRIATRRYVSAEGFAAIYTGLGDTDRAFEELERAYRDKSFTLRFLAKNPVFAPLRSDPRFADLVRRMGLPSA